MEDEMQSVDGIVSRIDVDRAPTRGTNFFSVLIMMVGDPNIYEGEINDKDQVVALRLTKPNDHVSFLFDRDFSDRILDFKNSNLNAEMNR